jgi:hypothetical protein
MSGNEAAGCLLCTLDAGTKQLVDNGCDVVSLRIAALCTIAALRTSIQAAAYRADYPAKL